MRPRRRLAIGKRAGPIFKVVSTTQRFFSTVKTTPKKDESINAFISFAKHDVTAKEGPLSALSIAVKDNICTKALPTTCASIMLKDFQPNYNATVVELLENSGAHIVGKTNCDEFGMGSMNLHSAFGPVINPYQHPSDSSPWSQRQQRSAGGSSGGSAAAVASGQCFAALSTDTGGSTRLPASYCGVVGLKPSYGLLSRWGVISYADSLDTVGVMASRVRDVRRVFEVVSRFDHKDPTSIPPDLRARAQSLCQLQAERSLPKDFISLEGLRIGIPQEYFPKELNQSSLKSYRQLLLHLKQQGASLTPVSLPSTQYALSAYYVLASAEASSNMARYDGIRYGTFIPTPLGTDKNQTARVYAHSRSDGFGHEVQKRILLGTYALNADAFDNYFLQAQRLRALIREDFDRVFRIANVLSDNPDTPTSSSDEGVDVLLHPSAICTAPLITDTPSQTLGTYVQDALTVPASLAGLPAMSIPSGIGDDGWPMGVSVVGQWGCDDMVLRVGELLDDMR